MTDLMKAVDLRRHYSVSRGFPEADRHREGGGWCVLHPQCRADARHSIGESGCGKSTLARMLALFEDRRTANCSSTASRSPSRCRHAQAPAPKRADGVPDPMAR